MSLVAVIPAFVLVSDFEFRVSNLQRCAPQWRLS